MAETASTALTNINDAGVPAIDLECLDKALDAVASQSPIVGTALRFNGKVGMWTAGKSDLEFDVSRRVFEIFLTTAEWGYQKWIGQTPADAQLGRIFEGFKMPKLGALPDRDPALWEIDRFDPTHTKKKDPWQPALFVRLQDMGDGIVYTFTTSSWSGISGVRQLVPEFVEMARADKKSRMFLRLGADKAKVGDTWQFNPIFHPVQPVNRQTPINQQASARAVGGRPVPPVNGYAGGNLPPQNPARRLPPLDPNTIPPPGHNFHDPLPPPHDTIPDQNYSGPYTGSADSRDDDIPF